MEDKILVVEDNKGMLLLIETYLVNEGYEVICFEEAPQALEYLKTEKPNLIISDIVMPEMDGFEFCAKVRQNPETSIIPFIFLTAEREEEKKVKGLKLGADDYIFKPFDPNDFLKRVERGVKLSHQASQVLSSDKLKGPKPAIEGNLTQLELPALIQIFEMGGKTGKLTIKKGNNIASLFFNDGQLVDGDLNGKKGEDEIYKLFGWESGDFVFEISQTPFPKTINRSTQGIVMEGLRLLGEGQIKREK